jgi:hypothetical protein
MSGKDLMDARRVAACARRFDFEQDQIEADIFALVEAARKNGRAAGIVEGLEMAAKIAQGPYPARSRYSEESPFYGSDLDPDRSEFGRGKQAGREAASAAIRARIAEIKKGRP